MYIVYIERERQRHRDIERETEHNFDRLARIENHFYQSTKEQQISFFDHIIRSLRILTIAWLFLHRFHPESSFAVDL